METNRLLIVQGDITKQKTDAIVNAANTSLLGGGGVDGAIHRAAGPELIEECRTLNGVETGRAKVTKGYKLFAKHIIHTAGPIWCGGMEGERELLASSYRECLMAAVMIGAKTVAFPSISTGLYHFPLEEAAPIAVGTILEFLAENDTIEQVIIVCFDRNTKAAYEKAIKG